MAERNGKLPWIRPNAFNARLAGWMRRARLSAGARDVVGRSTETLESYRKIIDLASAQAKIGVWECDLRTGKLNWSEGVYALFELSPGSRITRAQTVTFYHPESRQEMERLRAEAIREKHCFSLDARIRTARGNERWMRLTGNVECKNGVPVRLFGMKQDITEEVRSLERLRILAETDLLTGLGNRGMFQKRLEVEAQLPAAILLVDLDAFKQINDTFGHPAGDACLVQVAARLKSACPQNATLARLGGDEFAIVIEDGGAAAIEALTTRLLEDLRRPTEWQGRMIAMSVSIGVAISEPTHAQDASALLQEADLALYAAKAAGRDTSRFFVPGRGVDVPRMSDDDLQSADRQFDLFVALSVATSPDERVAA